MIVVHIGLPKSGSTTIQTFLGANEEALRKQSIEYPQVGRGRRIAHHNFAHELKGRIAKFNPASGTVSELADYLQEASCKTTLISSELLASCDRGMVERFGEALSGLGQPIRIVLIIRNLVDLAPSSYAQKIRYGLNTYDFDEFFKFMLAQDRFNPFQIASHWGATFGIDAIRVRVLEPAQLLNGDLIDDYLLTAGLDPDNPALRNLERQDRVNESAGWRTLEAVRALFGGACGLGEDHPLIKRVRNANSKHKNRLIGEAAETIGADFGWNGDRGRYLTRAQAQRLQDDYATGLRKLNDALSEKLPTPRDLDERGFIERSELPDARQIPKTELRRFYDAVGERLLLSDQGLSEARAAPAEG